MSKKSKLLKIWTRTATYLTAVAALVSFIEPISAGYIREWADNANPAQPRRMVQVVFGNTTRVDNYQGAGGFGDAVAIGDHNSVRTYMRNDLPPINGDTHIQFWVSRHLNTQPYHIQSALYGAEGARENAYIAAGMNLQPIAVPALNLPNEAPQAPGQILAQANVILPNVTFSLHVKHP